MLWRVLQRRAVPEPPKGAACTVGRPYLLAFNPSFY